MLLRKLSPILLISIICSGAGVMGELPPLGDYSNPENNQQYGTPNPYQEKKVEPSAETKKEVLTFPFAPNKTPEKFQSVIIKKGKFKEYLSDIDRIMPVIQEIKILFEQGKITRSQLQYLNEYLEQLMTNYMKNNITKTINDSQFSELNKFLNGYKNRFFEDQKIKFIEDAELKETNDYLNNAIVEYLRKNEVAYIQKIEALPTKNVAQKNKQPMEETKPPFNLIIEEKDKYDPKRPSILPRNKLRITQKQDMNDYLQGTDAEIEERFQLFCAKSHVITTYLNFMEDKYQGRAEKAYKSYKALKRLEENLNDNAKFWKNIVKFRNIYPPSLKQMKAENREINQRLGYSIDLINDTLLILKEKNAD